ncbi:hypothetical protein E2C01_042570 [Portunus trituberculatus]|uniref:Uncharacterized protein n=1 Tax=Portunus trituberculatus TaxID=210409 RepID=A0A5B7FTT6_PORTR|nr:hypothetical protein [Portunus trituberculatus]
MIKLYIGSTQRLTGVNTARETFISSSYSVPISGDMWEMRILGWGSIMSTNVRCKRGINKITSKISENPLTVAAAAATMAAATASVALVLLSSAANDLLHF